MGVVITPLAQPSGQKPKHDTYIADVTMDVADVQAVIPHGLGVDPQEFRIMPTLQGTANPWSTITVAHDATNLTVNKSGAANMEFNFRAWVMRPHTLGR